MISNLLPSPINTRIGFYLSVIIVSDLLIAQAIFGDIISIQDNDFNITKLDSTSIQVDYITKTADETGRLNLTHSRHDPQITITYQLVTIDEKYIKTLGPEACENVRPIRIHPDVDFENCKGKVNRFGRYNDSIETNYSRLFSYCKPHEAHMEAIGRSGFSVVITDLLPHQPYELHFKITQRMGTKTAIIVPHTFLKIVCMNDSPPMYAPLTDLGSFKIIPPINHDNQAHLKTRVELYWRPVPYYLSGSNGLTYKLICVSGDGQLISRTTINDYLTGMKEILIPENLRNLSSRCELGSLNHLGNSNYSSPIIIPNQASIIDTKDKFHLHVAGVTNNEYMLRWTNIEELVPEQVSIHRGIYTIYWCRVGAHTIGCASIEGIYKTTRTSLELEIPGDGTFEARIFGISYRSPDDKNFTGIIWSNCVAPIKSQSQSAYDPLIKIQAKAIPGNHTAMLLDWLMTGCESLIALIDSYEIDYCIIGQMDPCDSVSPISTENGSRFDFDNTTNCTTIKAPSRLISETTLEGLAASTKYALRVKHVMLNNDSSQWSNTVFFHTLADPAKAKNCRQVLSGIFWVLGSIVAVVIFYVPTRKRFHHYWKLLVRYQRAKSGGPPKIENIIRKRDNLSEMSLKYWINNIPSPVNGPSASSDASMLDDCELDTKDQEFPVGLYKDTYRQALSINDYVQNQPLTSHADQLTPDSFSESARDNIRNPLSDTDDISITSHSSFLENILNDDSDSHTRH